MKRLGYVRVAVTALGWRIVIGLILEFLLALLWEALLQVVGEMLIEFGLGSMAHSLRARTRAHPVVAVIGIILLGALAGAIASFIWPARILQPGPVRGTSLVLSPLITGAVMERYGQWRDARGGSRSHLATFWGGALFAFSMALVRFFWVKGYR